MRLLLLLLAVAVATTEAAWPSCPANSSSLVSTTPPALVEGGLIERELAQSYTFTQERAVTAFRVWLLSSSTGVTVTDPTTSARLYTSIPPPSVLTPGTFADFTLRHPTMFPIGSTIMLTYRAIVDPNNSERFRATTYASRASLDETKGVAVVARLYQNTTSFAYLPATNYTGYLPIFPVFDACPPPLRAEGDAKCYNERSSVFGLPPLDVPQLNAVVHTETGVREVARFIRVLRARNTRAVFFLPAVAGTYTMKLWLDSNHALLYQTACVIDAPINGTSFRECAFETYLDVGDYWFGFDVPGVTTDKSTGLTGVTISSSDSGMVAFGTLGGSAIRTDRTINHYGTVQGVFPNTTETHANHSTLFDLIYYDCPVCASDYVRNTSLPFTCVDKTPAPVVAASTTPVLSTMSIALLCAGVVGAALAGALLWAGLTHVSASAAEKAKLLKKTIQPYKR